MLVNQPVYSKAGTMRSSQNSFTHLDKSTKRMKHCDPKNALIIVLNSVWFYVVSHNFPIPQAKLHSLPPESYFPCYSIQNVTEVKSLVSTRRKQSRHLSANEINPLRQAPRSATESPDTVGPVASPDHTSIEGTILILEHLFSFSTWPDSNVFLLFNQSDLLVENAAFS